MSEIVVTYREFQQLQVRAAGQARPGRARAVVGHSPSRSPACVALLRVRGGGRSVWGRRKDRGGGGSVAWLVLAACFGVRGLWAPLIMPHNGPLRGPWGRGGARSPCGACGARPHPPAAPRRPRARARRACATMQAAGTAPPALAAAAHPPPPHPPQPLPPLQNLVLRNGPLISNGSGTVAGASVLYTVGAGHACVLEWGCWLAFPPIHVLGQCIVGRWQVALGEGRGEGQGAGQGRGSRAPVSSRRRWQASLQIRPSSHAKPPPHRLPHPTLPCPHTTDPLAPIHLHPATSTRAAPSTAGSVHDNPHTPPPRLPARPFTPRSLACMLPLFSLAVGCLACLRCAAGGAQQQQPAELRAAAGLWVERYRGGCAVQRAAGDHAHVPRHGRPPGAALAATR